MATSSIESLIVNLVGDSRQYLSMLKDAERATSMFSSSIQSSLDAVSKSFVTLGVGIAAPLSALGKLSVSAFSKFNQAFTESTAIMDNLTDKQSAKLKELAFNLSKVTTQGPTQLAKAFYFLASAGFDVEQSMKLLPQVTAFATAGMFDLNRASELSADALSALNLKTNDPQKNLQNLTKVTDNLVKGANLSTTSVGQLAAALTTQAGAAMKIFNRDLEEGIAVLSVFAAQGTKGEVAGQAYARLLRLLSDAANKNAGAFKFLKIRAFDARGELNKVPVIIGDMEKAFGKMSTRTRTAALNYLGFETRVQTALLPLLKTSKVMTDWERQLKGINNETRQIAEKQLKSFASQTQILYNYIEILAIAIGERLAPYIGSLSEMVKKGIQSFFNLSSKTKEFIIQTITLVGTITLALTSFSLLRTVLGFVFGGLGILPAVILALTVAVSTAAAYVVVYAGGWKELYRIVNETVTNGLKYAVDVISTLITRYKTAIIVTASFVASIYTVYSVVRLVTATIITLKSVLIALATSQLVTKTLWLSWVVALGLVKTSIMIFNALSIALSLALLNLGAVVTGLNMSLALMDALIAVGHVLGFIATIVVLGTAFAILYSLVVAFFTALSSTYEMLVNFSGIPSRLGKITDVFAQWGEVVQALRKSIQSDIPLALEIVMGYTKLVISRFRDMWPPLWEYIRRGFDILLDHFLNQFRVSFNSTFSNIQYELRKMATVNIWGDPTSQTNRIQGEQDRFNQRLEKDRKSIERQTLIGLNLAAKEFDKGPVAQVSERTKKAQEELDKLLKRASEIKDVTPEAPIPESLKDQVKKWTDILEDAGEEAGEGFASGMSKGMQSEFFSYGSQAHLRQIEDYLNRVMGFEGGSKAGGGRKSKKQLFQDALKLDEGIKDAIGPSGKGKISVLSEFEERPDRIDLGEETIAQFKYMFENLNRTFIALAQGRQDLLPSLPLLNLVSSQTSRQVSSLQPPQLTPSSGSNIAGVGNQTKILEDIKRTNTKTSESSKSTSDKTTETNKLLDVLNRRLQRGGDLNFEGFNLFR